VRSFSTLPPQLRRRYLSLGVVADFAAPESEGSPELATADGLNCRF